MGEYISFCSGVLCVVFRASALVDILHFPVDLADGVGAQAQARRVVRGKSRCDL